MDGRSKKSDSQKANSSSSNTREDEFHGADQDAAALLGTSDAEEVVDELLTGHPSRPTRAHIVNAAREGHGGGPQDKASYGKKSASSTAEAAAVLRESGVPVHLPDPRAAGKDVEDEVIAVTTTQASGATSTTTATANAATPSVRQRAGPRYFSTGLFACFESCGTCYEACCCAYCMAGTHHNFFRSNRSSMSCCICCCLCSADAALSFVWCATIGFPTPAALMCHTCFMRQAVRRRYHLEGEEQSCVVTDCCVVCCCLSCAMAQHQREIAARGEWCATVCCSQSVVGVPTQVDLV